MRVLYRAIRVVVRPLQKNGLKKFVVTTRHLVEWKRVPLQVLYCCNIRERRSMLAMRQCVVVKKQCVGRIGTGEKINCGAITSESSMRSTGMIRSRLLGVLRIDTGSNESETVVVQEEKEECRQNFLRHNSLST